MVQMALSSFLRFASCAGFALAAACTPTAEATTSEDAPVVPQGKLVQTSSEFLDTDLLQVIVLATGSRSKDVSAFADCAAAYAAEQNGFSFLRQIRTNVERVDGGLQGDAVYSVSVQEPDGLVILVARDILSNCSDATHTTLRGEVDG